MKESKHERAATECEGDAGSITGSALNEVSMARRGFLGRIARWSAALAAFGLGPEALMQAVSKRSIMSTAVAAGAARDRRLHPFPSDDPYNMPIGVNAWYAPLSDPATAQFAVNRGYININNGVSHPIFRPSTADPTHTINMDVNHSWYGGQKVESYRSEENGTLSIQERLQLTAEPSGGDEMAAWSDRHLHILIDNELVELYRFFREGGLNSGIATVYSLRIVRNRLDRYSFGRGTSGFPINDPLKNTSGTRAWGGSAIAGLIRRHEVDTETPHIPHALAIILRYRNTDAGNGNSQIGRQGQGDTGSPLYGVSRMFPATEIDRFNYTGANGACRMGMRFALPPSCTDDWINENAPKLDGQPNKWQVALARAARDYGIIVADSGSPPINAMSGEVGIPLTIENHLNGSTNYLTKWMFPHMRRVAGAGPVHNPSEANWKTWANAGNGWGGGAPRVPYSSPLAPLSRNVPQPLPESPRAIQVTETRTFDGTG